MAMVGKRQGDPYMGSNRGKMAQMETELAKLKQENASLREGIPKGAQQGAPPKKLN